jgi:hypothetical protein
MTRTFAWQQTVSKVNEFIGTKKDWIPRDDYNCNTGLKDVYVENRGSATLYVRIKFNEAMNLASGTWRPGAGDWAAHIPKTSVADCGNSDAQNQLFHNYFTWTMGGWKYYMPYNGSELVGGDTRTFTGNEPGVRETPRNSSVITMQQYAALGSDTARAAFVGWIYDTDGYAYWSQPLKANETTGLLLHQVNADSSLSSADYYYAIDVIYEVVDRTDLPMWVNGANSADNPGIKGIQASHLGQTALKLIASLDAANPASFEGEIENE